MPTSKNRPGAWNDDVLWLLARIAGLTASQKKGTGSADIPRGTATSPVSHYIRLTPTDLSSLDVVTLQMPATSTKQWRLLSAQWHRISGSATTWAPRIGQTPSFVNDGPDDRLELPSQAFTDPIRKVYCQPIPMTADGTNKLYFKPSLNAGTDNDLDLQFWFTQNFETEESA